MVSKLRSQRGATLIMAFFLLILCSTVGSIILTAATANVGRISEQTEYDQKYYKVISAARLFADEIADISRDGITLTITSAGEGIMIDSQITSPDGGIIDSPALSEILQEGIARIYKGTDDLESETLDWETVEKYLTENFMDIGRDENHSASEPIDFTIQIKENGKTDSISTVYGRLAVQAWRMKGDIDPSLDSVTHNITAVFYSDIEDTENQTIDGNIPDDAYVVKLVCPSDSVYPRRSTLERPGIEDGETIIEESVSITFYWQRENMQISQVRGVA